MQGMLDGFLRTWRQLSMQERVLLVVLAGGWLIAFALFLYRVAGDTQGTDFPEFHQAGRHLWEEGRRDPDSILHRYLPSVDVAWIPLGMLPRMVAAGIYLVFTFLTWLGLLHACRRYLLPTTPLDDQRIVLLTAALLTLPFAMDHMLLGAFHLLMIWLMVEGVGRVLTERPRSGTCLLGLAIWLKLLPLLAVPYLLLKRRISAALIAVLFAFGLNAVLSLGAYGWPEAWTAHQQWWELRGAGDLRDLLNAPGYLTQQRDRNQSSPAVLRRLLTSTGDAKGPVYRRVSVSDFSLSSLKAVYGAFSIGLLGILAWFGRHPAERLSAGRRAVEIALLALATLWFSPIVFGYHPVAATPALAVILGTSWERSRAKKAALLCWLVAMLLMIPATGRAAGVILWASLVLGFVLMATAAGSRRAGDRGHDDTMQGTDSPLPEAPSHFASSPA